MADHNLSPARHLAAQVAVDDAQDVVVAALDATGVGSSEALTFLDGTNLDNAPVTIGVTHFQRVDDIVIVSGRVTIDPTAGGAVEFGIPFPTGHAIADVAAATEVHGHLICANGDAGLISGDTTNERASANYTATDGTATTAYFTFSYVAD
jgi:hypothetical protein